MVEIRSHTIGVLPTRTGVALAHADNLAVRSVRVVEDEVLVPVLRGRLRPSGREHGERGGEQREREDDGSQTAELSDDIRHVCLLF